MKKIVYSLLILAGICICLYIYRDQLMPQVEEISEWFNPGPQPDPIQQQKTAANEPPAQKSVLAAPAEEKEEQKVKDDIFDTRNEENSPYPKGLIIHELNYLDENATTEIITAQHMATLSEQWSEYQNSANVKPITVIDEFNLRQVGKNNFVFDYRDDYAVTVTVDGTSVAVYVSEIDGNPIETFL